MQQANKNIPRLLIAVFNKRFYFIKQRQLPTLISLHQLAVGFVDGYQMVVFV